MKALAVAALVSCAHPQFIAAPLPTTRNGNPYALQELPGATQSAGWLDAWSAAASKLAVAAKTTADVVAAVNYAREHHLRIVVKGTGHDYLGRSNAADALLIWTHAMRDIRVHDAFVPQGCSAAPVPAVSVGAGTRWGEVYQAVTVEHGRYVQGGGCTSVGAAGGFLQGGGFGSWSKKYGIAAAGLLEVEVVTADGQIRIANACQNSDLFWALKGGGGGTFGVVTRVTLMTHPLPNFFGWVSGDIKAKSVAAYRELLARFVAFYREHLCNEHWGEQVSIRTDTLHLSLAFEGLSAAEAEKIWQPFRDWAAGQPDKFDVSIHFFAAPATKMWNADAIRAIAPDALRTDPASGRFWWKDDSDQVMIFWYAYQSRWIPLAAFDDRLANALFEASRHWSVGLHFNKGQAGASEDAIRRGRETSMNPAVFDAAALAILATGSDALPGVGGHEPNVAEGREAAGRISEAMRILRAITPNAGSYVNETDYFEPDWQRAFWGDNYPKLLAIKHKYDPEGLFRCHHCVGSDEK